jgi:mannose-6-phosphate isomerase-like protein (cupin superfamily)
MNLEDFFKGWIVGDFDPSIIRTKDVEIGLKTYKKNEVESPHYHKVATEWTCVISGKISMNGKIFSKGEIVKVNPGEINEFVSLDDSVTLVIKSPSITEDKFIVE